ncbi:MAG: sugar phosphate isomerase/epimerase, partial [Bacteroidales bacterium]|nr:sugar phosphate isomerase/epimerase [Bacteroidales bacterium]
MESKNKSKGMVSRRKFLGSTAAIAAASVIPSGLAGRSVPSSFFIQSSQKPNSNFGGVQIGAITYSWRSMPGGVENIIKYSQQAGLSSIELMSNDLETYLGAPENPSRGMFGPPPAAQPPAGGQAPGAPQPAQGAPAQPAAPAQPGAQQQPQGQRREMTPEQKEAAAKYAAQLKEWRLSLPMSKVEAARKLFENAGIKVPIVKFSPARWSDEEIDYAFKVAKAMGAKGVTDEIGEEAVKKLGPIAAKHGMYAIFHNHMQFATPGFSYDPFLAVSPAVMMNFDAGHFFGSTGIHPNTIIEKYHDRIFSIHLKDKT